MKRLLCSVSCLVSLCLLAGPAFAQSAAAQEKTIPGGWLTVAAYAALWLSVLVYMMYLAARQRKVDHDINDLERRLDDLLDID